MDAIFSIVLAGVERCCSGLQHIVHWPVSLSSLFAFCGMALSLESVPSDTEKPPRRHRPPKVLMLGWEFPPAITGGLGIACHDLCAALAKHVRLTVVIPRSEKSQSMRNIKLLGLNRLKSTDMSDTLLTAEGEGLQTEVHYLSAELHPYSQYEKATVSATTAAGEIPAILEDLDLGELYGPRMLEKVMRYAQRVVSLSRNMHYDLVHAHDWMTLLAGMEIKQRTGKPLVAHVHALEYDRVGPESRSPIYHIEKAGLEMADLVLPVSNYTAQIIQNHYGISPDKIIPVHNGIRKARTYRSAKPFSEKIVLFVGRLTRQKAPEQFLEIAARVLEQYNNVRFVVAGTGDSFESLVWKSAYKYLGHRFHYTGFLNHEQMSELLSMADVYCMPSISEPFGLSALEAAQFGVPCVISKQSGVSEVLHGALSFDFWDTEKAARHVVSLLSDEALRSSIVADAYRDLTEITWDNAARKVLDAYRLLPAFQKTELILN